MTRLVLYLSVCLYRTMHHIEHILDECIYFLCILTKMRRLWEWEKLRVQSFLYIFCFVLVFVVVELKAFFTNTVKWSGGKLNWWPGLAGAKPNNSWRYGSVRQTLGGPVTIIWFSYKLHTIRSQVTFISMLPRAALECRFVQHQWPLCFNRNIRAQWVRVVCKDITSKRKHCSRWKYWDYCCLGTSSHIAHSMRAYTHTPAHTDIDTHSISSIRCLLLLFVCRVKCMHRIDLLHKKERRCTGFCAFDAGCTWHVFMKNIVCSGLLH